MPSPVPFRKVRKLLEDAGWRLEQIRGSHHKFKKEGCKTYVVPVHKNQVKAGYVQQIQKDFAEAEGADEG